MFGWGVICLFQGVLYATSGKYTRTLFFVLNCNFSRVDLDELKSI